MEPGNFRHLQPGRGHEYSHGQLSGRFPAILHHNRALEPVLKSTFLWSADAPQHHADHRKVKHSLRIFDFGFVVAYQAAVLHKPAEGALDDPTPGQHFEAALVLETGDNFQAQAAGLAMRGDPSCKSSPQIALIGPDTTQPTKPLKALGEESASAGLLVNIGRGHTNPEQQAQGVHQNVALAPFDLLACIVTPRPA